MSININQLEKADAQNKLPLSNNTGVLEFSLLASADFTVSSNVISANPMAYADVVGGAAPIISATPSGAPSPIANNAVLIRKYDDLVRIWMRSSGTWAHVFDIV